MIKKNEILLRGLLYSIFLKTAWEGIPFHPKYIKPENNILIRQKFHLYDSEWGSHYTIQELKTQIKNYKKHKICTNN